MGLDGIMVFSPADFNSSSPKHIVGHAIARIFSPLLFSLYLAHATSRKGQVSLRAIL